MQKKKKEELSLKYSVVIWVLTTVSQWKNNQKMLILDVFKFVKNGLHSG